MEPWRDQPLLRLACWDAYRSPFSGWSDSKIAQVFGTQPPYHWHTWPPAARGLPLGERKTLGQLGLHRLNTQLALALTNLTQQGDVDLTHFRQWMVDGFEQQVWRGADRRMLEIAHHYRAHELSDPSQIRANGLGPIFVGLSIASERSTTVQSVIRRTVKATQTVYQSYETSIVAGHVAAAVKVGAGQWEPPLNHPGNFVSEGIPERIVDLLRQPAAEKDDGIVFSSKTLIKRINEFMALPIGQRSFDTSPAGTHTQTMTYIEPLSHILDDGMATWSASSVDDLVDGERLKNYVLALANETVPHESKVEFLKNEAILSQKERLYQDSMAAERRI